MVETTANYKFYYFPSNAIGASIRAILAYESERNQKVTWENVAIELKDWPNWKSKFPNGQVPVLEFKGNYYTQALAIEVYLSKTFGLFGSSIEDEYQILNLQASREDLVKILKPLLWPNEEEKK